jgi:NAD(P)-dependent dehydrogenase (short-subunit alcohol dehydrogenase family)
MNVSDAVAIVTGAGSGIGRQLAMQLAAKGAQLALNDYDAELLAGTQREIEVLGGRVIGEAFDVGSLEAMRAFADRVEQHYGRADIVVNNAGVALGPMNLDDVSYADFEWIVKVNLWGVIHGTMAFLPLLRLRPQASLVNVCSAYGLLAVPRQVPYCATKFAVRGFTDALRLELMDTNIRVTLVCPSQVKTNILRNGRHKDEAAKADIVRKFDERMTRHSADDMARAILSGIEHGRETVVYGRDARIFSFASRFLPLSVIKSAARKALRRFESY